MRKRLTVLALALSAVLLTAAAATAGTTVPFKGSDVGTFGVPGPCDVNSLNVVIGGEGTATHLGHYSYSANECFDPTTGAFGGAATFTAASGDQLWGTYIGEVGPTSDPDVISYVETFTITGGSGRFAEAGGELVITGLANLATGDYSQSLRGWIANLGLSRG